MRAQRRVGAVVASGARHTSIEGSRGGGAHGTGGARGRATRGIEPLRALHRSRGAVAPVARGARLARHGARGRRCARGTPGARPGAEGRVRVRGAGEGRYGRVGTAAAVGARRAHAGTGDVGEGASGAGQAVRLAFGRVRARSTRGRRHVRVQARRAWRAQHAVGLAGQ